MDIKVCMGQYEEGGSSHPWTEAVLFKAGKQVAYTEPSEDYLREWSLEYKGDEYFANVSINEREENKMIRREDIINELADRGYEAEVHTSIKNGMEFDGIRFMNDNGICPVIYTDEIIADSRSSSEAAEKILDIYNNADIMDFNKENLLDPDFIIQNLYIGMQKTSTENIVKTETDFEGIEKYLYVKINENATFKLTYGLLETLKISNKKAWEAAEKITFAKTEIMSLMERLSELMGQKIDEMEGIPTQYIVTNTMNYRGASAILDMVVLRELAQKLGVQRFFVLPSSIHEMIVIPDEGKCNIEELSDMVQEVNQTQVKPEERLTDQAYIIEV